MSKKVVTCRDFKRYPGSVFVTPTVIPDSATIQMKAKDWVGVATSIVNDTPLTPTEPKPEPIREHRARLTPATIHAVIEQMDRRWLKPSEILSVATTQFRIEAEPKALKKVLHGLFMSGKLADKQVGSQIWYRYLAVNWRLKNSIVVNMKKLQRLSEWNTASRIKDEMYDKYNLLTVESVQEALDTLSETDAQMLVEVIDGKRQYHLRVGSAPAPSKLKVKDLLSQVDALLGLGVRS